MDFDKHREDIKYKLIFQYKNNLLPSLFKHEEILEYVYENYGFQHTHKKTHTRYGNSSKTCI